MSSFANLNVLGNATFANPATAAQHPVRKQEFEAAINAIANHAAVTKLDTTSVTLTLAGQQISAAVRLKSASFTATEGQVLATADGLVVVLGTGANQAAAGNHTHSTATAGAAGFMSAADKAKLDGVAAGATALSLDGSGSAGTAARSDHTHSDLSASISGLTTSLAGKQASDPTLTAIAGVTTAADKLIYFTGVDVAASATLTSFARSLLDDVDAAAARSTLGLVIGTNVQAYSVTLGLHAALALAADKLVYATGSASLATTTLTSFARTLLDDADAATMRSTLGLAIGTNVQAFHATLTALAGLTLAADKLIYATGANSLATSTLSAFARALLDDVDAVAARATLGITSSAGPKFSVYSSVSQSIPVSEWTRVDWPAEIRDSHNNFASHRFTPTVAGTYQLVAMATLEGTTADRTYQLAIYKNGAAHRYGYKSVVGSIEVGVTPFVSAVVEANGTTDYFEIYIQHNDTAANDIIPLETVSYFDGFFLP